MKLRRGFAWILASVLLTESFLPAFAKTEGDASASPSSSAAGAAPRPGPGRTAPRPARESRRGPRPGSGKTAPRPAVPEARVGSVSNPGETPTLFGAVRAGCARWFSQGPAVAAYLKQATYPIGLVAGVFSNNVVMTYALGFSVLPDAVSAFVPFFNETANVLKSATGQEWLYTGLTKRAVDGIATGAIAGAALGTIPGHDVLGGALNFALGMGLTFWFPNRYFHPIMEALPDAVKSAAVVTGNMTDVRLFSAQGTEALRSAGHHRVGQGVIGIAMIYALDQVYEHANELVLHVSDHFGREEPEPRRPEAKKRAQFPAPVPSAPALPSRAIANAFPERPRTAAKLRTEHALALFFLAARLEKLPAAHQARALLWIAGTTPAGEVFAGRSPYPLPGPALPKGVERSVRELLAAESFRSVLSPSEIAAIGANLDAYQSAAR